MYWRFLRIRSETATLPPDYSRPTCRSQHPRLTGSRRRLPQPGGAAPASLRAARLGTPPSPFPYQKPLPSLHRSGARGLSTNLRARSVAAGATASRGPPPPGDRAGPPLGGPRLGARGVRAGGSGPPWLRQGVRPGGGGGLPGPLGSAPERRPGFGVRLRRARQPAPRWCRWVEAVCRRWGRLKGRACLKVCVCDGPGASVRCSHAKGSRGSHQARLAWRPPARNLSGLLGEAAETGRHLHLER